MTPKKHGPSGTAEGWLPIESAPKDERILVVHNMTTGYRVTVGVWVDDRYNKKPRPYWGGEVADVWGVVVARKNPPLYWMPLPSPPAKVA